MPDHRFAVVALSNSETPAVRTVDAAIEALLPVEPPRSRADGTPAAVDLADAQAFAGRYENRGHFDLSIEHNAMVLEQNDGPPLPVMRLGNDLYVAAGPNNQPRLRVMLKRATGDAPATMHFALWAYPRVTR